MFRNRLELKMKIKLNIIPAAGLIMAIGLAFGAVCGPVQVQVQAQAQAQTHTVLTIVFRDSLGNPLQGVTTEILSYYWGLEMGQAYSVIARGETDQNGVVAFDNTRWPNSGYRVRFTPTGHTKPANTYFLPASQNQYRGYPGLTTGGMTETNKFVVSGSDGLTYNDISREGQLPEYQRDPVAGMAKPRVSVMDGKDFIASVVAATATAEARGEPTPTMPPPAAASPRPGEIQPALTITPAAAALTAAAKATGSATKPSTTQTAIASTSTPRPISPGSPTGTTQTTSVVVAQAEQSPASTPLANSGSGTSGSATRATPAAANTGVIVPTNNNTTGNSSSGGGSNLLVSLLLALFGITCLVLFWKYRFRIYPLFGIEASPNSGPRKKVNSRARLTVRPVKTPQPPPASAQPTNRQPDQTASSNDATKEKEEEVD